MDMDTNGLVKLRERINDSPTILQQMIFPPDAPSRQGVGTYQDGVKAAFEHVVKPAVMLKTGLRVYYHIPNEAFIDSVVLKSVPEWNPVPYYSPYDHISPYNYPKWLKRITIRWLRYQVKNYTIPKERARALTRLGNELETELSVIDFGNGEILTYKDAHPSRRHLPVPLKINNGHR